MSFEVSPDANYGSNVRALRTAAGLTQEQLAAELALRGGFPFHQEAGDE